MLNKDREASSSTSNGISIDAFDEENIENAV